MNLIVSASELIEHPRDLRPHVVLLGAGASRAAFPSGDAGGRLLPVMNDLVDVVGLSPLLTKAGLVAGADFETLYAGLAASDPPLPILKEIEDKVSEYFASLSLPTNATLYDRLLLGLRGSDAIFTFNWDPFLFDAYQRNRGVVSLPGIFFLHGNVRIGACVEHSQFGSRGDRCGGCGRKYADVPLLYPITKKDYSKGGFIAAQWESAGALLAEAFTMTVFGYGAPASDVEAVELLKKAWLALSDRKMEHVEVIDIQPSSVLRDRWAAFTPTHHFQSHADFGESRISRWPRRSCESLYFPMAEGRPCEDFPMPETNDLDKLQRYCADVARFEI